MRRRCWNERGGEKETRTRIHRWIAPENDAVSHNPDLQTIECNNCCSKGDSITFQLGNLIFKNMDIFLVSCVLDCSSFLDWQSDVLSLPYFVSKSEAWVVQQWIRVIAIYGHWNNNHTHRPSAQLKQHFFLKKRITVKKCLSRPPAIREEESFLRQSISISSFGGGEREKPFLSPPPFLAKIPESFLSCLLCGSDWFAEKKPGN